ncbi:PfaD family polyunsaturated fatty acid/polyketide biosynthesis protein [Nocardia sp. NPDC101769]|uniref:PfaD family polyunsaturated fatty acid/polyketide biosynthesis protein n=1 Tax=Nocardia sp. NPDC101769 TaxID=3364333 RepID=UPI0037F49B6B
MTISADSVRNGSAATVFTDVAGIRQALFDLERPCFVIRDGKSIGMSNQPVAGDRELLAVAPPCPPRLLGSSGFRASYRLRAAYMAGAMAGGIASVPLVIALAKAGYLGSFGTGGLGLDRIESALGQLAASIPDAYLVNLLHSPQDRGREAGTVDLFLRHRVTAVEASAFLGLTPELVRYRVSGLSRRDGRVNVGHRIMAKVSRVEVGRKFLSPAPESMVAELLRRGQVDAEQAELAKLVPMADDITVEADSGGHTDGRPLVALLPHFLRERESVRVGFQPAGAVRIGAAGGIGTPEAIAAAYMLGAEYVVTGSVNQICIEADVSAPAKALLAAADITDFGSAPAADMFEIGAQVQVLKKGTLFAQRGQRLRELYDRYESLEELPDAERNWLEQKVLRGPIDTVWHQIREYLTATNPGELAAADQDPRLRMSLLFRWYLGLSSRWAREGEATRLVDFQLWAGPSLGSFNRWTMGTPLADADQRTVARVADHLMLGAAVTTRVHHLRTLGIRLPAAVADYRPELF